MTQTQYTASHAVVRCRRCGHAVSVVSTAAAFCPHCGAPVRMARRGWPIPAALFFVALTAGGLLVNHRAGRPRFDGPPVGPVDAMLVAAEDARDARAAALDARAAEVDAARQALAAQVGDLSNLARRIAAAVARADDEGRWPAVVAGRSLQRSDADVLLQKIHAAVTAEQRAIDHDARAHDGLAVAAATVRGEAADIRSLRQQLSADPSPEQRADIDRRAAEYRDGSAHLPDAAGLVADPAKPIDADSLLR